MNEFDQQEALLQERRKAYAQQLAGAQAPQGRMVGNTYVAANPLEYLAAGLRGVGALRGQDMAEQDLKNVQAQRAEGNQKALAEYLRQSQGTPENAPQDGVGPTMPAQAPNLQGAYGALMQAPDQSLRQMGMQGAMRLPEMQAQQQERVDNRAFRQQEAEAARAAQMEQLRMRMEDQRASQQERLQAQRDLRQMQIDAQKATQQMIAANRPERQAQIIQTDAGPMQLINGKAVPILGPDGKPVQSKAAGGGAATEGERKAATLLQRMQSSEAQLEAATAQDKGAEKPGLIASGLSKMGLDAAANVVTPENRQKVEAAQLDILDAALTLGTGAAYTKEQLEGYRKSYFPQIGDKPQTIKDKQDRLNNILEAAKIAAGRAGGQVTAAPPPSANPAAPKRLKFDAQGNIIQ